MMPRLQTILRTMMFVMFLSGISACQSDSSDSSSSTQTKGLIAFVSERDGNAEIYVMNPDGKNARRISQTEASDHDPVWSPDGTRIAFESGGLPNDAPNFLTTEIYVANADGSDVRNLTQHEANDTFGSWSPDGTQIVFYSDRDKPPENTFLGGDIYVINADGSNVRNLTQTQDANEYDPAWSPDGTLIAYVAITPDSVDAGFWSQLYVMNADGSDPHLLLGDDVQTNSPTWSPDGKQIAFISEVGHIYDLVGEFGRRVGYNQRFC